MDTENHIVELGIAEVREDQDFSVKSTFQSYIKRTKDKKKKKPYKTDDNFQEDKILKTNLKAEFRMANHGPNPGQYSVEKCKECKKGDEICCNIGHQCNCCGCTFGSFFNHISFSSRENGKKRRDSLSQTLLGNSSFPLISFYVQLNVIQWFGSLVRLGGLLVSEVCAMFTICQRESAG